MPFWRFPGGSHLTRACALLVLSRAVTVGSSSSTCGSNECEEIVREEVELLQKTQHWHGRIGTALESSALSGSGWSLLEPNPEFLQWEFRGFYWKGNVSELPEGAVDDLHMCIFLQKDDGLRRSACTEEEKKVLIKKYSLMENDFFMTLVGYLMVPLEYDKMKSSSNIALKLRVSAFLGPAGPNAPIILRHCGGPSSCDLCAMTSGEDPAIGASFTWIGIQQRGMTTYADAPKGRYPHPDHAVDIVGKVFDGVCEGAHTLRPAKVAGKQYGLKDFTTCVCDLPEDPSVAYPAPFPNAEDEEKVRSWFTFSASRDRACYNADYWKLPMGDHTYNFLDFVGTQMLAMDLDRLREAVGHRKLNILGYSYGTAVGASYLATFPQNSGNVVLNGNVHPGPGVDDYYKSVADAARQGMAKLVRICDRQSTFLPEKTLATCQVPGADPLAYFFDVVGRISGNASSGSPSLYAAKTWSGEDFTLTPEMLYHYLARMASSRARNQKMWVESLRTILALGADDAEVVRAATLEILNFACPDAWYDYNYCWPVMMNTIETNDNCITSRAVRAADYTNRFTIEGAMDTYRRLAREYHPVEVYFANAKAGFGLQTWPADAAPGLYGFRAGVSPFIINSLYDMSTPYTNAKLMRQGFPDGVLVTWQGVGHCVSGADYDPEGVKSCIAQQTQYLVTGQLPPDGFTCHQTKYINAASVTPS